MSVAELTLPRVLFVPDAASSAGQEAIDLAALAGLVLDPWEAFVLERSLAERADGFWAAAEVGLCVPRQNGKNAILEARELAGLFLLDEHLLIHSAHHFKTAKEQFLRILELIEGTPDLDRKVRRVSRTHGEEGIELLDGTRLLFFARTKSSGRGFTAPFVAFDEAMYLPESSMGALMPTMSAMPNRQRWYTGSAVDQQIHPDGVVFARVRERAIKGDDPRLAYFEWSVDVERPDLLDDEQVSDEAGWSLSNPGLDIRISREAVGDELRTLDRRTFAVERLGVGDWPETDPGADHVIAIATWLALTDEKSELLDPVCFAFDVAPDRASASIAAAGRRSDGLFHVEVTHHRRGTGWLVPTLTALRDKWNPVAVMADASGPAGSLLHRLDEVGIVVEPVGASDHARACGQLLDVVEVEGLRHLGSGELVSALKGATKRPLGDAWAWSRKNSTVDISPLVAVTLALWGSATLGWNPDDEPRIY